MNDEEKWRDHAACQNIPDAIALFFPGHGQPTKYAKRICMVCPVKKPCLEYALDNSIRYGVWGGVSELERRKMRRERKRGIQRDLAS